MLAHWKVFCKNKCLSESDIIATVFKTLSTNRHDILHKVNPKRPGLLGVVLFGEIKFVLSNFLSSEDLSTSYES